MAQNRNSEFIDIPELIKQYLSKWYLFAISIVICGALAYTYVKVRQPEYAVKANVLISTEKESPMASAASALGGMAALFGSDAYVEDEIFIISSHSLYRDVTRNLGTNIKYKVKRNFLSSELAYPHHPLEVIPQAGMLDTLESKIQFAVKVNAEGKANIKAYMHDHVVAQVKKATLPYTLDTPLGQFTFTPTQYYAAGKSLKTSISVSGYDAAAEGLDENVNNEIASKRTNVISLRINTTNPIYGKDILNEIIKEYNNRGINEKNGQNELTAKFIDSRLDILAKELDITETQIQKYKQEKGIIDVVSEATYQTTKKGQLEEQLIAVRTQEEIIKLTLNFLKDPQNAYALIPTSLDNQSIQRSIEIYNEAILERMDVENSAQGDNAALRNISERIDMMRQNIITSVQSALNETRVSINDLSKEMAHAETTLSNIPEQEREVINMKRQQAVQQELFVFLLQRREETAMMLANAYPKGIVVDDAYTMSEPLGLKGKLIMLIALIFGFLITPVYLYLRKLINNRFETRQEVERITDVPILGEICIDNSGEQLVATAENNSSAAELFRLMRSNLLFVLNDPRDKVVLMTSSSSGEGKSFISINIASSLALLNKKVVLVGMDIRNPRIAQYLGIAPQYGVTQYLSSNVNIQQIITPMPGANNLDVICAGPVPPNPAELLASAKVDELFAELRNIYDYIIVDTAPIGLVSDTFTLDRLADAAVYVCRANFTKLSDLQLVNEIYEQQRLKKLSIVINGTAAKKSYGYGGEKRS
ncbi:MAG: polysaccharide biosynthesis tyrosine autokinase [Muribaculaceae bacterium]|nr:polysaccharide biosynthesis tyrosine autokinase [Muribaculaceae bacterium]